ncbi:hypothetical protein I6E50_11670 [Roseburia hominis]|uniref:hypothetical protein n=1 Tax=Roseburia hominis TaxID=301301 RepID=UPI001F37AD53|nr:hypothetical protein [Roseburia hominis]
MNSNKDFLKANLENKVSYLQDEHKIVLQAIYDDACEKGVVHDFEYDKHLCQSISFTELSKNVDVSDMVLNICLVDLERMGFIINTMRNSYKETEYAIWYLGLEYFKELQ